MIEIKLKNLEDFKRLVRSQGTVYFKKTPHGFTYYMISEEAKVGIAFAYESSRPLKFHENFDPEDPDGTSVGFLVEIEGIFPLHEEDHT